MTDEEKRECITRYIDCYNAFDVQGMLCVLDDGVRFQNISGGHITHETVGKAAFEELASQSISLFTHRKQEILDLQITPEGATANILFEGHAARDLGNRISAGDQIRFEGVSRFRISDGLITSITDEAT